MGGKKGCGVGWGWMGKPGARFRRASYAVLESMLHLEGHEEPSGGLNRLEVRSVLETALWLQ